MARVEHWPGWPDVLLRFVPHHRPASRRPAEPTAGPAAGQSIDERVERAVLHGPRRYTRRQIHLMTGVEEQRTRRLWRSMGFPDVAEDDVVFTDADLDPLDQLEQLRVAGLVPADVQDAVIRSIAQAMAGLADWQVKWLYQFVEHPPEGVDVEQVLDVTDRVLPALENLQTFVWRRQLVAAAVRRVANRTEHPETRTMTVGSADLVGFTRTARGLTPAELVDLIELFHGIAADVAAGQHGRIVKTIGDEVLFVADQPEQAAELALDLMDRTIHAGGLPELRIGMALGPVLPRFGDVFGEVVHTASRLSSHARPGRILLDHDLALALDGDRRFTMRLRRPISVPGYPRLQPWGLRRTPPAHD